MPASSADAIFWIAVACCSVAQLAIIRSVIISQSRSAAAASSDVAAPRSPSRRAAELAWAVLPGIALIVLFLFTWRAMHEFHITAQVMAGVRP